MSGTGNQSCQQNRKLDKKAAKFFHDFQLVLLFTEIVLKSRLDADQEIITSIRYLTRDKKYSLNKILKKFCQKHGFLGANEDFDSESGLAKSVFVISQVVYTIVTILHPPILFSSYYLSCVFLVCVFTIGKQQIIFN